jgi:hypothetical protein
MLMHHAEDACLTDFLQEGKYLTVGKSERAKDSGQQLLADMAIQTNARWVFLVTPALQGFKLFLPTRGHQISGVTL